MKVEIVLRNPTFTESLYSAIVELSVLPREGDILNLGGIEFKGDNTGEIFYPCKYRGYKVNNVFFEVAKDEYSCWLEYLV